MNVSKGFEVIAGGIGAIYDTTAHNKKALKDAFEKAHIDFADPFIALNAAKTGNVKVLRALRDVGINMTTTRDEEDYTMIHLAAQYGHEEVVEELWSFGVSAYTKTKSKGFTPAHVAAYAGHAEIVKFLCDKNRELLTAQDKEGNTFLHWAAFENRLDVVKYALKKDPGLASVTNKASETPLAFCRRSPQSTVEVAVVLVPYESAKPAPPAK